MCGIVGYINRDGRKASLSEVSKMIDAVPHRGPDNQDIYTYQNVAFGHARLSIIDLSNLAHQPMHSDNGAYTLTYNGEIYNYREIRAELECKGYKFISSSDTEVLLYAYVEWGSECVAKFNGMFALAILDRVEQVVFFARDRYGIKPLYYGEFNNTFLFGSEIKSIEANTEYKFDINKSALKEYFTFQNFISSETLNLGVEMFPAGHFGILDLKTKKTIQLQQYWDFNFIEPSESASEDEYAEELLRLFEKAVERQLVADVPLGAYLSGGMDSGSIVAVASKKVNNLHTFTCGFDMSTAGLNEAEFDEREKALSFSRYFKTQHHEKLISSLDMERSLPKLSWHLEEPRVGQSYPNYYAAKLARSKVKVVLSGAGGDELFAGYPWRYYRAMVNSSPENYIDKYYNYWQRLISEENQEKFFQPIWQDVRDYSTRDAFSSVYGNNLSEANSPEDYLNQSLYFEAKIFLHGLLVVEDKLSMAHSLESRVPILDNDLVDFAMKIPARFKLNGIEKLLATHRSKKKTNIDAFSGRSADGKQIFRKAMANILPTTTAQREKQGFSGPDASWFQKDSAEYIRSNICNKNAKIYQYVDYTYVKKLLDQHFQGRDNSRLLIWSLLSTENWLKTHCG